MESAGRGLIAESRQPRVPAGIADPASLICAFLPDDALLQAFKARRAKGRDDCPVLPRLEKNRAPATATGSISQLRRVIDPKRQVAQHLDFLRNRRHQVIDHAVLGRNV